MAEGFDPSYEDYYEDDYDRPTEDENIALDDWGQTPDEFVKPPEEETSLSLPEAPGTIESPATQEKIESFYKCLDNNGFNVNKNAPLEHKARFTKSADNKLGIISSSSSVGCAAGDRKFSPITSVLSQVSYSLWV